MSRTTPPQSETAAAVADRVKALVYTSVDDLRSGLRHVRNGAVLTMARDLCASLGYKTKLQLIERRLRQLDRKEAA